MLLIEQASHLIICHHRHNVLSTLTDNPAKVKQILKEPGIALDNVNNPCLFG